MAWYLIAATLCFAMHNNNRKHCTMVEFPFELTHHNIPGLSHPTPSPSSGWSALSCSPSRQDRKILRRYRNLAAAWKSPQPCNEVQPVDHVSLTTTSWMSHWYLLGRHRREECKQSCRRRPRICLNWLHQSRRQERSPPLRRIGTYSSSILCTGYIFHCGRRFQSPWSARLERAEVVSTARWLRHTVIALRWQICYLGVSSIARQSWWPVRMPRMTRLLLT